MTDPTEHKYSSADIAICWFDGTYSLSQVVLLFKLKVPLWAETYRAFMVGCSLGLWQLGVLFLLPEDG